MSAQDSFQLLSRITHRVYGDLAQSLNIKMASLTDNRHLQSYAQIDPNAKDIFQQICSDAARLRSDDAIDVTTIGHFRESASKAAELLDALALTYARINPRRLKDSTSLLGDGPFGDICNILRHRTYIAGVPKDEDIAKIAAAAGFSTQDQAYKLAVRELKKGLQEALKNTDRKPLLPILEALEKEQRDGAGNPELAASLQKKLAAGVGASVAG